jgi:hypothetical protein
VCNAKLAPVVGRSLDGRSDFSLDLIVQLANGGLELDLVLVERDLRETDQRLAGSVDHVLCAVERKR